MLFEKLGNFFSESEHRDRYDPSPLRVRFHLLFEYRRPPPPYPPKSPPSRSFTIKPFIKKVLLEEMEGVNDNASAFMHLNIQT